jgi:hypothetical protein
LSAFFPDFSARRFLSTYYRKGGMQCAFRDPSLAEGRIMLTSMIETIGMSPDERRREIVRTLAAGIQRLHERHALRKSPAERLDVSPEIVLSGESQRPSRAKKTSRPGVTST